MRKLAEMLEALPEFQQTLAALENGRCPAAVSGLSPVHRAHFAANLRHATGRPVVLVCADEEEGDRLERDLAALTGETVTRLSAREFNFYGGAASREAAPP